MISSGCLFSVGVEVWCRVDFFLAGAFVYIHGMVSRGFYSNLSQSS